MKKLLLLFFTIHFSLFTLEAQSWLWGAQGKGTVEDAWAIAVDTSKNVYQTGIFGLTANFGPYSLTDDQGQDCVFLVKYDHCGNVLWAKQSKVKYPSASFGTSVTVDKKNNPIVTGSFADTVSFGSFQLTSLSGDFFLTKYDASGNVLWSEQSKSPSPASNGKANTVAIDPSNNIYVSGYFTDTLMVGPYMLKSIYYSSNIFLVKYDVNGNILWAKQSLVPSNSSNGVAYGMAVDAFGNAYITGQFQDTISIGPVNLISRSPSVFLIKYDPNGNVLWGRQSSEPSTYSYGFGISVTADKTGNTYMTGAIDNDTIIFGADTLKTKYADGFLVKYDPNGNLLFAKQTIGLDPVGSMGRAISSDTVGGIYFTVGEEAPMSTSKIIYQNDTFTVNNTEDATLILKVDYLGNLVCGSFLPTGSDDYNGVASDPGGNYVYFGSDLGTKVILGPDTLNLCCGSPDEQSFVGRWQACDKRIASCDSLLPCTSFSSAVNGINTICTGQSVTLTASGGTNYLWSNGATTDTITVVPSQSTKYKVTISNGSCNTKDSITINVNPLPGASACCDSSIIPGQSVQLTASGGAVYIWNPPTGLSCNICPDPLATPSQTTTYTLTITSDSGCTSQQTITIDVSCGSVFVPNAFSPNNDGQNDVLYVKGYCITTMHFAIYDRWGNKVFETTNPNEGWDGLYAGKPENAGTYVYYLKANMRDGTVVDKKGNISLVR